MRLRDTTAPLAAQMTAEIISKIPEYARPDDEAYVKTVHRGVTQAVRRFLEVLDGRGAGTDSWRELYWEIGAGELREGRSLDAVHAAIRLCARIAWQQLLDDADRDAIPLRELGPVVESIFAYLDEIAEASAQGYAHAKAAEVGESDRRRRRLVALLTATPPVPAEVLASAAAAARWSVPGTLAAVVLDGAPDPFTRPVLPPDILADFDRAQPCLVVPNPDTGRQVHDLIRHLARHRAVIGPSVGPREAARSLRWALQALDLLRRGVIAGGDAIWCRDHLSTLAMFQDEELLDALIERCLAPLRSRAVRQHAALADTLLAWLRANGNANKVAADLHIHPQTARHRLRQIAHLFGDTLEDADARFELQIALRADRARREQSVPPEQPGDARVRQAAVSRTTPPGWW